MRRFFVIILFTPFYTAAQSSLDSSITKSSLQKTVAYLAADSLLGRLTGSDGATKAAFFIVEKFRAAGLVPPPGSETFFDSFAHNQFRKKITGINVTGYLPSSVGNDSLVIISAHYDHIGQGNDLEYNKDYRSDDAIFNGANDNATGVAAMLELAKYFASRGDNHYNLLFIAFGGEEMGLVGSTAFVKKSNLTLVKAVINLEMLGRPVNGKCYVISLGNSKLKKHLNQTLQSATGAAPKDFFGSDTYYEDNLEVRSDHYPFARKIKNAFTIMASSPTDDFYHSVDDEYETIDFDFLLTATKNIAQAIRYFTK